MAYNPKYTNGMPGRDWDILNTQLTSSIIPEIEKDTIAMIRYLANNFKQVDESWLFKAGGLTALLGEDSRELADRFATKMKNSGSWILGIAGRMVTLVQVELLKITMQALGGDSKKFDKNLAQVLAEAELRKAETPLENEFIDVLIQSLPKFLEMSPAGLEKFKMAPNRAKKSDSLQQQRGQTLQPQATQQPKPIGQVSGDVLNALDAGLKSLVPAEVQAIRSGRAQSIYPLEAMNAVINTTKFRRAKGSYENRKKREEREYETERKNIERIRTENELEKENRRKKTRKTILILTIIAAVVAVLFFMLKLAATVPEEKVMGICAPVAFVIAVIIGIVWHHHNGEGGFKAWFISYIVIAVVLMLVFMGARALFNVDASNGSRVLQSVTLQVDKTRARVNDTISLSFVSNPEHPKKALVDEDTEEDYDEKCIEYHMRRNGREVQLSSRQVTFEYTFETAGKYVFWAEYCQHDNCDGTYDVVSEEITVIVVG